MLPRSRKFERDFLSLEDWNYIRGLFLADGCARMKRWWKSETASYLVEFYLGENESELGNRLLGLLIRAGLNPWMNKRTQTEHMLVVSTYSKPFFEFLPDKNALQKTSWVRERFFEENKLFTSKFGIPFVAGLLDGDGYCGCVLRRRRVFFGEVERCMWAFTQRKYLFLIEYMMKFIETLSPGSMRLREYDHGTIDIELRKSAIDALLNAGLDKYSWKARQWLEKVGEARSERANYFTTGQVARLLKVSRQTVYRLVKAGKIKYVRGQVSWTRGPSIHYIPVGEVERLRSKPK